MEFGVWQSGFSATWGDLRGFLTAMRWDRSGLLWLSFVPLLFAALEYRAATRMSAVAAQLGWPNAILRAFPRRPQRGILRQSAFGIAWSALVIAMAGPRWGSSEEGGIAVGRDVIVVIDLSRSMLAEDLATPNARWQAARDAALDLIAAARKRGGHRIGIVIFAARPKVLVPLTTDYDHLRQMLEELDATVQPVVIRPADESAKSGTRIGAALTLAVQAHDERFHGKRDIILLSDGDDPADDREWVEGIGTARTAEIPIHVVGLGDVVDSPVLLKRRSGAEGDLISTRLHEDPLREIARDSHGDYLPARREPARLGAFFRTHLEPLPSRELTDDAAVLPRDRSAAFWLLGLASLLLAWHWRA